MREYIIFKFTFTQLLYMRRWSSGMMPPSHGGGPGSIPGRRISVKDKNAKHRSISISQQNKKGTISVC